MPCGPGGRASTGAAPASTGTLVERALARPSRLGRPRPRRRKRAWSCATARSTSAPAPTASTCSTRATGGRRRSTTGGHRTDGRAVRDPSQPGLRHEHGPARRTCPRRWTTSPRWQPCCEARANRSSCRPRTGEVVATMKTMAGWCGEAGQPHRLRDAGAAAHPRRRRPRQDRGVRRARCPARATPQRRAAGRQRRRRSPAASSSATRRCSRASCCIRLLREGAPFVYGCGLDALNMRTMVAAYCLPESLLGLQADGRPGSLLRVAQLQLRRYVGRQGAGRSVGPRGCA